MRVKRGFTLTTEKLMRVSEKGGVSRGIFEPKGDEVMGC